MGHYKIKYLLWLALLASCTHQPQVPANAVSNYPPAVGRILIGKCAIAGCHNNNSYENAAGLNLTTWDSLFLGTASTGATVIPYRADFSSFCYFINPDSTLGLKLDPAMPLTGGPLSKEEYIIIRDWISSGAPDAYGNIKFTGQPARKKFYVTNRLCDVVTVFDAATLLQMAFVDVGNKAATEFPYCVKVSPDKKNWYVSFFVQSDIVQQFDAATDKLVSEIKLGQGMWYSFVITSDSHYGFFADNSSPGKIVYADLRTRHVLATYTFNGNFKYPNCIALNERLKKLYVGSTSGNFIYSIDITDPLTPSMREVPIDHSGGVQYQSVLDPTDIIADTVHDKCYVACAASHEIRVIDMVHDSLLATIQLPAMPAFMSFSYATQKLFVTCPDDGTTFAGAGRRGSVVIVDAISNTINKTLYSGYQPYGIAVDDDRNLAAVVNANITGGASHHVSGCGKRNGNVVFIDLTTMALVPNVRREVAVFPFSSAAR